MELRHCPRTSTLEILILTLLVAVGCAAGLRDRGADAGARADGGPEHDARAPEDARPLLPDAPLPGLATDASRADAGDVTPCPGGDCATSCGNGVRETGEMCDLDCPVACDDGLACTHDAMRGAAVDCTAECISTPVAWCAIADGCCATGCTERTDDDCGRSCGTTACVADGCCVSACMWTSVDPDCRFVPSTSPGALASSASGQFWVARSAGGWLIVSAHSSAGDTRWERTVDTLAEGIFRGVSIDFWQAGDDEIVYVSSVRLPNAWSDYGATEVRVYALDGATGDTRSAFTCAGLGRVWDTSVSAQGLALVASVSSPGATHCFGPASDRPTVGITLSPDGYTNRFALPPALEEIRRDTSLGVMPLPWTGNIVSVDWWGDRIATSGQVGATISIASGEVHAVGGVPTAPAVGVELTMPATWLRAAAQQDDRRLRLFGAASGGVETFDVDILDGTRGPTESIALSSIFGAERQSDWFFVRGRRRPGDVDALFVRPAAGGTTRMVDLVAWSTATWSGGVYVSSGSGVSSLPFPPR